MATCAARDTPTRADLARARATPHAYLLGLQSGILNVADTHPQSTGHSPIHTNPKPPKPLTEWLGEAVGRIVLSESMMQLDFLKRVGASRPGCMQEVVASLTDAQLGDAILLVHNWRGAPVQAILTLHIEKRILCERVSVYDALRLPDTPPWMAESLLRKPLAFMEVC